MNNDTRQAKPAFLETKEYRRFAEFCDACRTSRYIGLCHGYPGVGKTLSAWQYTKWHLIQPFYPERFYLNHRLPYATSSIIEALAKNPNPIPAEIGSSQSIFYTVPVSNTPKQVEQEIQAVRLAYSYLVDASRNGLPQYAPEELLRIRTLPDPTELIIIDEADRLKMPTLEQIRDMYDHGNIGMVFIGMPGLEKRLSRYPQLYSRVGFVHEFKALNAEESRVYLSEQWKHWGIPHNPASATEAEAIAATIRITQGNFRLLNRLLAQIERICEINKLRVVSKEVVEIARQQLVIGSG
jgi:DNA transposition AAA+ family ATPase